jgi:hypothetical protein
MAGVLGCGLSGGHETWLFAFVNFLRVNMRSLWHGDSHTPSFRWDQDTNMQQVIRNGRER